MEFKDLSSLTSEDQAKNWLLGLVQEAVEARNNCNVFFPDPGETLVTTQQKRYRRFLLLHGCTLGVLLALFRCNMISSVCYNELHKKVLNTLVPTIIG